MHLGLDQRSDLDDTGLATPHKGEDVPIRLQGTGTTDTRLSRMQDPVEEVVEHLNGNELQRRHRVFANVFAVPVGLRIRGGTEL